MWKQFIRDSRGCSLEGVAAPLDSTRFSNSSWGAFVTSGTKNHISSHEQQPRDAKIKRRRLLEMSGKGMCRGFMVSSLQLSVWSRPPWRPRLSFIHEIKRLLSKNITSLRSKRKQKMSKNDAFHAVRMSLCNQMFYPDGKIYIYTPCTYIINKKSFSCIEIYL